MSLKKKLLIGLAVVALCIASAGLGSLAAGTYGTEADPLVTRSYLEETVMGQIREELGGMLEEKSAELAERLDEQLSSAAENEGGDRVDGDLRFSVITMQSGERLVCAVGTEIMLRIGTAESYGPSNPRLIDETTGSAVSEAGQPLEKNHMYMVTIKNNGITATSNVYVVVRGEYTISK